MLASLATVAFGQEDQFYEDRDRPKENVWSVGVAGSHYHYEFGEHSLIGPGAIFEFGFGKYQQRVMYGLGFQALLGPYTKIREANISTDFFGTGLKIRMAYALSPYRRENPAWDIGIGLNYADMVGRSIDNNGPDDHQISELMMRISNFSAVAGIGFNQIAVARKFGNSPEHLLTRVEGFSIHLDASYPIKATHTTKYTVSARNDAGRYRFSEFKEKGDLIGFAVILTASAHLGI
jgi:hypothetical protein